MQDWSSDHLAYKWVSNQQVLRQDGGEAYRAVFLLDVVKMRLRAAVVEVGDITPVVCGECAGKRLHALQLNRVHLNCLIHVRPLQCVFEQPASQSTLSTLVRVI